jgi:hypothetical protein
MDDNNQVPHMMRKVSAANGFSGLASIHKGNSHKSPTLDAMIPMPSEPYQRKRFYSTFNDIEQNVAYYASKRQPQPFDNLSASNMSTNFSNSDIQKRNENLRNQNGQPEAHLLN